MKDEKPLHVQVAEALGHRVRDASYECKRQCIGNVYDEGPFPSVSHLTHRHGGWQWWRQYPYEEDGTWERCPLFDVDWSATGPLIEKYAIDVEGPRGNLEPWMAGAWRPHDEPLTHERKGGDTPLIAVCKLIIALAQQGQLDRDAVAKGL